MTDASARFTGRCYCGGITLSAQESPQTVAYCHCTDCRRITRAPVFETAVYLLHAFQKKARRGIATPKQELDLARRRLAFAQRHFHDTHRGG